MGQVDTLMTCAELALALAGFSGIILVLRRRTSDQRLRITGLLSTAFGALLFALAPVALFHLTLSADAVWRISSVVMASYMTVVLVFLLPRAMADRETLARLPLFILIWSVAGANVAIQLANAVLLPARIRFGIYFSGIVLTLLVGVVAFSAFLVPPRRS